jgi:glycosidase
MRIFSWVRAIAVAPGLWARAGVALLALGAGLAAHAQETAHGHEATRALAPAWQRGAFMEVFVRAYQDSDGDGVGDLRGLIQRLDYLRDLGVKGIWLMPVTASADHDHGYAATDYRRIAPEYGTLEDFDELLRQAHARGMGVIMDYVINHSAKEHPFFVSALQQGPASPTYDWYVWEQQAPQGWDIWGQNPWTATPQGYYFATFGPHMPDFNFRNPAVRAYHADSLRYWLDRGLDGYRLDAVPHLVENNARDWNDQPESRALTGQLRALITAYPQRHVVCEATANPEAYAAPDVCGSAFAFGLERKLLDAAQAKPGSVRALAQALQTLPPTMATFLANHDIFAGTRVADQLHGDLAAYRLAAATYLLGPGTPFIYYGEEIGMAGVPNLPGDLPLRAPMRWSADASGGGFTTGTPFRPLSPNGTGFNVAQQSADPQSLLNFYRAMLALRNGHAALTQGVLDDARARGTVLAYRRTQGHEQAWVVLNYGRRASSITLPAKQQQQRWARLYPATAKAAASGLGRITVPAQSLQVWQSVP